MRLASVAAFVLVNLACASAPPQPSAEVVGVADLMNAKSTFVGRRISVEGRVRVQTISGLHACGPGERCPKYDDALLALVNPRATNVSAEELLALYRKNANGKAEPVHCQIVDENVPAFDCGSYTADAVVVVEGTFTKEQVPDQAVVDPGGRVRVLSYRDTFYLLID